METRETIRRAVAGDGWTSVTELALVHFGGERTDAGRAAMLRAVRALEAEGVLVTRTWVERWHEIQRPRCLKPWAWAPCRGVQRCTPCFYGLGPDPPGYWDPPRPGLPKWVGDDQRELERKHGSHAWEPRRGSVPPMGTPWGRLARDQVVPVYGLYVASPEYAARWDAEQQRAAEAREARAAAAVAGRG
jgi:hypothetical protein